MQRLSDLLRTVTGFIYCRIRNSSRIIVQEFTNPLDSSSLTNVDFTQPFSQPNVQHTIEAKDINIYYSDGADPGNYVCVMITLSEKADWANIYLVTDDAAKTISNVDKDWDIKVNG